MQDAGNSKLYMTAVYKRGSSSLHGFGPVRLGALELLLEEEQLNS